MKKVTTQYLCDQCGALALTCSPRILEATTSHDPEAQFRVRLVAHWAIKDTYYEQRTGPALQVPQSDVDQSEPPHLCIACWDVQLRTLATARPDA